MLTMRRGAVLLVGVAILGCTAGPDQVSAPGRGFDTSEPLFQAGGATQRVTGHANVFLPAFQAEQKYSNSAIRHANGSVTGEFELKSEQDGGLRVHGDVICFTIVGNRARLGGFIEKSTIPDFEGLYAVWTIIDNGEGANDPPDQTSDFFLVLSAATAQLHCTVGFNLAPFLPVLGGNLQVHQ
jgi:hypothetical protein